VAQVNESWDCQSSGDFIFCNIAGLPWIFLLFKCDLHLHPPLHIAPALFWLMEIFLRQVFREDLQHLQKKENGSGCSTGSCANQRKNKKNVYMYTRIKARETHILAIKRLCFQSQQNYNPMCKSASERRLSS